MNSGLVATRYAKALLEFANEQLTAAQVYDEAKIVVQSFIEHPQLKSALENPVLDKAEKKKIIVLAGGGNLSETFSKFIDLLLDNKREMYLQTAALKYLDLYRKAQHIFSGKLVTATPIDAVTENKLTQVMINRTGGAVEIQKTVDPQIMGGFLFEVDFVRMDASLSGQLKRIKREYIEK